MKRAYDVRCVWSRMYIYNECERRCLYGPSVCVETSVKSFSRSPVGVMMNGSRGVCVLVVMVDVGCGCGCECG